MATPTSFDGLSGTGSVFPVIIRRERLALHLVLFILTLLTTTIVGAGMADTFRRNAGIDLDRDIGFVLNIWSHPRLLLDGLPFSLALMTILMAHEFGHYLACLRYGIDASLPYFLPAPTLIGTLGAFIRIRSPIYTRKALFDVGVAGPIAGFVCLVPMLITGLLCSHVQHGIADRGDFIFGNPLVLRLLEKLVFPGVPAADISLHPIARAAWVGILATALNLLPIGQLDGGHILYSFFARQHKWLSRIFVAALAILAPLYSWTWLVWAVLLGLFGLRHPVICDTTEMNQERVWIGWAALAMFILCFTLVPIRSGS